MHQEDGAAITINLSNGRKVNIKDHDNSTMGAIGFLHFISKNLIFKIQIFSPFFTGENGITLASDSVVKYFPHPLSEDIQQCTWSRTSDEQILGFSFSIFSFFFSILMYNHSLNFNNV